jgi:hypothetical protein
MDTTDSTRLDHDPAASSMPRVRPWTTRPSARAADDLMASVGRLISSERQQAAHYALLLVGRALNVAGPDQAAAVLDGLLRHENVTAALEALDHIVGLGHDPVVRTPDQGGGS